MRFDTEYIHSLPETLSGLRAFNPSTLEAGAGSSLLSKFQDSQGYTGKKKCSQNTKWGEREDRKEGKERVRDGGREEEKKEGRKGREITKG